MLFCSFFAIFINFCLFDVAATKRETVQVKSKVKLFVKSLLVWLLEECDTHCVGIQISERLAARLCYLIQGLSSALRNV